MLSLLTTPSLFSSVVMKSVRLWRTSVFFSPLASLIAFDFLGWWHPLNAFTLGLVGATFLPAQG
jgi:hypothetical protein